MSDEHAWHAREVDLSAFLEANKSRIRWFIQGLVRERLVEILGEPVVDDSTSYGERWDDLQAIPGWNGLEAKARVTFADTDFRMAQIEDAFGRPTAAKAKEGE